MVLRVQHGSPGRAAPHALLRAPHAGGSRAGILHRVAWIAWLYENAAGEKVDERFRTDLALSHGGACK